MLRINPQIIQSTPLMNLHHALQTIITTKMKKLMGMTWATKRRIITSGWLAALLSGSCLREVLLVQVRFAGQSSLSHSFRLSLVSRTCTAPFDRLKIFLITRPPELGGSSLTQEGGTKAIAMAVTRIYAEGGIRAFWIGNGLSVAKIFPESAIKFMSYETSVSVNLSFSRQLLSVFHQKRMFAKYVDHVEDPRDISGVSRFLSGGMGGITSQLSACPALVDSVSSMSK